MGRSDRDSRDRRRSERNSKPASNQDIFIKPEPMDSERFPPPSKSYRHSSQNHRHQQQENIHRSDPVDTRRSRHAPPTHSGCRLRDPEVIEQDMPDRDFKRRRLHSPVVLDQKEHIHGRRLKPENEVTHNLEPSGLLDSEPAPLDKQKVNLGLSGKLTEDTNTFKGVVINYSEPSEARKPTEHWRLYAFKGNKTLSILHIHRQSGFLIGRDRKIADIPMDHPSISKQHAALQYRLVKGLVRLYLIDLESANGTYLNNSRLEPRRYYELIQRDVIKFGYSSREYVVMTAQLDDDEDEDDDSVAADPVISLDPSI